MMSILRTFYIEQSVLTTLWIISLVVSSVFGYYWDVYRDWGMLYYDAASKHRHIPPHDPVFPMWFFYTSLLSNLVMRAGWSLTVSPSALGVSSDGGLDPLWFASILAFVEIFRRAQWNMHRVAHEQTANCGKFRAVAYVPIPIAASAKSKT
jgi:hypothetical protein